MQVLYKESSENSIYNKYIDANNKKLGIIACGIAYNYLMENYPEGCPYPVLKIGQYPLPPKQVYKLLEECEEILVLEDGYPLIEELIKVSQDKKVKEIYYVDVTGIRDVKEIDEEGNINTKDEGTEAYRILIEKMSNVLDDYTLKQNEKEIEVGEKRIYAPNVVAISKGKAIQLETGISDELKDPYGKLTEKKGDKNE